MRVEFLSGTMARSFAEVDVRRRQLIRAIGRGLIESSYRRKRSQPFGTSLGRSVRGTVLAMLSWRRTKRPGMKIETQLRLLAAVTILGIVWLTALVITNPI